MRKRSKYRPKPVILDNMAYVLSGKTNIIKIKFWEVNQTIKDVGFGEFFWFLPH